MQTMLSILSKGFEKGDGNSGNPVRQYPTPKLKATQPLSDRLAGSNEWLPSSIKSGASPRGG